jgi:hypothetical protein
VTAPTLLDLSILGALLILSAAALIAIVAALRTGGRRTEVFEVHPAISASRFTIPVSVILPVTRASVSLSDTIAATLALRYPEIEVVVIVDAGKNADMDTLTREWQLQAREFFFRLTIPAAPVRRIYRSLRDSRVTVIDKPFTDYADAVNCGVNIARYRYVVTLPPDITFDAGALLRLMSPALRDPAAVVGVSNHVERGAAFQRLTSIRSLLETRLVWSRLRCGLGPSGSVVAWRRDAVLKLGGFSLGAADPDLDMMFRLQATREGHERVERSAEVFGRVDSETLDGLLERAGRRPRAAAALLLHCVRRGPGRFDTNALLFFFAVEMLAPLAEAWLFAGSVAGALAGWLSWTAPLWALMLLCFGNAAVSAVALLVRGAGADAPDMREMVRLLATGPLEFVLVRPALAGARIVGMLGRTE